MKEKRLKQWMQSGAWRDRDARCCSPVALIFIYCTHSNGPVCLARQMAHYIFKIYWNDCGARFVLMEWFRETERSRSSLFHFLIDTYFNWINSRYPIPCGVLIYWLHICNLQTHCQCHQENWPPSFRFCFFFFPCRLNWLWTILFADLNEVRMEISLAFVFCHRAGRCAHNWRQDQNNSKFPNIHSTPFSILSRIYQSLSVRSAHANKTKNQRISFYCKMYEMLAEVTPIYTVPFLLHKVNAQSRLYCGHGCKRCSLWHRH